MSENISVILQLKADIDDAHRATQALNALLQAAQDAGGSFQPLLDALNNLENLTGNIENVGAALGALIDGMGHLERTATDVNRLRQEIEGLGDDADPTKLDALREKLEHLAKVSLAVSKLEPGARENIGDGPNSEQANLALDSVMTVVNRMRAESTAMMDSLDRDKIEDVRMTGGRVMDYATPTAQEQQPTTPETIQPGIVVSAQHQQDPDKKRQVEREQVRKLDELAGALAPKQPDLDPDRQGDRDSTAIVGELQRINKILQDTATQEKQERRQEKQTGSGITPNRIAGMLAGGSLVAIVLGFLRNAFTNAAQIQRTDTQMDRRIGDDFGEIRGAGRQFGHLAQPTTAFVRQVAAETNEVDVRDIADMMGFGRNFGLDLGETARAARMERVAGVDVNNDALNYLAQTAENTGVSRGRMGEMVDAMSGLTEQMAARFVDDPLAQASAMMQFSADVFGDFRGQGQMGANFSQRMLSGLEGPLDPVKSVMLQQLMPGANFWEMFKASREMTPELAAGFVEKIRGSGMTDQMKNFTAFQMFGEQLKPSEIEKLMSVDQSALNRLKSGDMSFADAGITDFSEAGKGAVSPLERKEASLEKAMENMGGHLSAIIDAQIVAYETLSGDLGNAKEALLGMVGNIFGKESDIYQMTVAGAELGSNMMQLAQKASDLFTKGDKAKAISEKMDAPDYKTRMEGRTMIDQEVGIFLDSMGVTDDVKNVAAPIIGNAWAGAANPKEYAGDFVTGRATAMQRMGNIADFAAPWISNPLDPNILFSRLMKELAPAVGTMAPGMPTLGGLEQSIRTGEPLTERQNERLKAYGDMFGTGLTDRESALVTAFENLLNRRTDDADLRKTWEGGKMQELTFNMPITVNAPDYSVKRITQQAEVARGAAKEAVEGVFLEFTPEEKVRQQPYQVAP